MRRDEYPVMTTSTLDLLIHIEGEIHGNQQSTYDNCVGRGGHQQKLHMGKQFDQKQQGGTQGGTKENTTLVPGRGGTTLNATRYNYCKPGQIDCNCSEAGRTGTCSLNISHSFSQKHIKRNEPINKNRVILDTFSSASVLKDAYLAKNPKL